MGESFESESPQIRVWWVDCRDCNRSPKKRVENTLLKKTILLLRHPGSRSLAPGRREGGNLRRIIARFRFAIQPSEWCSFPHFREYCYGCTAFSRM
jgi:hypothetical protein